MTNVKALISLIPGRASRILIPYGNSTAGLEHQTPAVSAIKYFSVGLDNYLEGQARSSSSLLCKTFLGGCDATKDKAWTARISWPATVCMLHFPLSSTDVTNSTSLQTPAEFTISVVEGTGSIESSTTSHDRIIKVEVRSAGVPVPPQSPLSIFRRKSTRNESSFNNARQAEPFHDDITQSSRPAADDSLVFDIVVEPLLFGVVPMESWYTGAVVVSSIIIGVLATSVLFRVTSI